jgi:beta-lactam-binding protein with PASTA domain
MPAIFISYRRNDSEGEAGRLFDDLVEEFGENSVFMDVAAIEAGRDFRKAIDESVATCGVVLALVGKNWLDAKDDNGKRRLDDPADFVRLETASALRRDIPVIPVIVRGATMPHADQLPEDLRDLAYRNCVELTHARWSSDLQLLLTALHRQLGVDKSEPAPAQPEAAELPPAGAQPPAEPRKIDLAPEMKFDPVGTPPEKPQKSLRTFIGVGVVALLALVGSFLLLSRGVTAPNLRGKTVTDATATLEARHLKVGQTTVRPDGTQNPGTVLSQFPPSQEQVKRGASIDLVISGPVAMVEVPAVTGQSLDAAQRALADHQLNSGDIQRQARAGVARDTVLQQFPQPGESVKTGARIDLLVADAPPQTAAAPPPTATKAADDKWAAQRAEAKRVAAAKAAAEKAASEKAAANKAIGDKAAGAQAATGKPVTAGAAAAATPPSVAATTPAATSKPAATQSGQPQVTLRSATCTTVKPGQYRIDLAGEAYAPAGETYLFYAWAAVGANGTRWRPECKSWSVPQSNDDPLWEVTCIHRPNDPPQTTWQTSRFINSQTNQPPTNGGTAIFKPGVHSASTLKFNFTCK